MLYCPFFCPFFYIILKNSTKKGISDLITSISLVCTQNFSTIPTTKRLSKLKRSKLTIESPLSEIIVGLLLGDGHIQKRSFFNKHFKKLTIKINIRFFFVKKKTS